MYTFFESNLLREIGASLSAAFFIFSLLCSSYLVMVAFLCSLLSGLMYCTVFGQWFSL